MDNAMVSPVNLAVIGLGAQAREHLAASRDMPGIRIVAGVDASPEAASAAKTLCPGLRIFSSIRELLAGHEALGLQGLVLALPHHAYAPEWANILLFGLPLLKEKPLGRNYEEAQRFVAQSVEAGCPLQTAIQRRHHPSYGFLRDRLAESASRIDEVHGHLHLGKPPRSPAQADGWRNDREQSGGGALLDAGYHLVDLVQFLTGPFDVVSSSLFASDRPDDGRMIEDRAWLTGRSERAWIMLDIWVQGEPTQEGGLRKSEAVRISSSSGEWLANREGVWLDGERLFTADNRWSLAMRDQLNLFARRIRGQAPWRDDTYWDQLPAVRVIEEAYRLSSRY